MGGFLAGLAGTGAPAQELGAQLRSHAFQHQQNELNRWQMQHAALADAVERAAGRYAGPEGERLRDLQMEVHSLRPGTELTPLFQKYTQHRQSAEKEIAQRAAQGATAGTAGPGIPPVSTAAPPQAPLAPMMSAPAAQSPVNPVQGGAGAQGAAFPSAATVPASTASPSAVGPVGQSPAGAIEPVPSQSIVAPNAALPPPAVGHEPLNLQRSFDAFNNTGYIDPVTEAMIPGQAQLAGGIQKLPIVRQILEELQQPKPSADGQPQFPDINNLMRVQAELSALGVQGGGVGNMLGPMLTAMTPQAEAGMTTVAALEATHPGFLATQGYDISTLDPDTPLRVQVNKFTRMPVSAQVQSVANRFVFGPHGEVIPVNPRTNETAPPVAGAVNPAFVPQQTSSVLNVPGQLPQTTVTTRQRGTGAVAGSSKGGTIKPVVPPASSGGSTQGGAAPASLVGRKYQDWVNGGPAPTGKELTAVQEYARQNNLSSPQPMSPTGQKALAAIDPIIAEVDRALETINNFPGFDKLNKADLAKAKMKYDVGLDDPLSALIADLGFADIRSAAQALQNTGSRAERIMNKALEHTPNISILRFDEPSLIKKKLGEMKIRLKEARDATLEDEKKSGVLQGAPPVPAGAGSRPPLSSFERH